MCVCNIRPLLLALSLITAIGSEAEAEVSFAGKTVTIYVGYGPGGGYDLYARVLAHHLPRHLPGGPTVIVSNMPGAASVRACELRLYYRALRWHSIGHLRAIRRRGA